jgi:hypothetical protein
VQAFLEPVRQFVDSIDRVVAHQFVMSHSGSRGGSRRIPFGRGRGCSKQNRFGKRSNSCRFVNRSAASSHQINAAAIRRVPMGTGPRMIQDRSDHGPRVSMTGRAENERGRDTSPASLISSRCVLTK